ncbi:hypothetical protein [Streptomyces sp. 049-1]|uniref:hypothetical protein n=1 Tax=Streptomyces sp. 049-1 TaxID=2789264 RepID=UPI00397E96B1
MTNQHLLNDDQQVARQAEDTDSDLLPDLMCHLPEPDDDTDTWPEEAYPLSADEERLVAGISAHTINLTMARMFLRLGPPPTGAHGDLVPASNGDGGTER